MLVTNEEAVLKLRSQGPEWKPSGLNGWMPWVRRIRYSASQKNSEKTITLRAYCFQSWPSASGFTRSTL